MARLDSSVKSSSSRSKWHANNSAFHSASAFFGIYLSETLYGVDSQGAPAFESTDMNAKQGGLAVAAWPTVVPIMGNASLQPLFLLFSDDEHDHEHVY